MKLAVALEADSVSAVPAHSHVYLAAPATSPVLAL